MKYLRNLLLWCLGLYVMCTPVHAQVTTPSVHVYPVLLGVCCAVLVVIFCVVFYTILKHRRLQEYQSSRFYKSIWSEMGWTILPFLLVIAMLWPVLHAVLQ